MGTYNGQAIFRMGAATNQTFVGSWGTPQNNWTVWTDGKCVASDTITATNGIISGAGITMNVTTSAPPALITSFVGAITITNNGTVYHVPVF